MARNKYPEETVNLILDVSMKLFMEKGYDQTSIQDIIDHLGGLSKGAIYHHFKSKEDIMIAVSYRMTQGINLKMTAIANDNRLTGLEKIQKMFIVSLQNPEHSKLFAAAPSILDNPQILAILMKNLMYDVVPNYAEGIIKEGIKDGSIQSDHPEELAEVLMLLSNVWLNPLVFKMSSEKLAQRVQYFAEMMTKLGLPLVNEELMDLLDHLRMLAER